MKNFKELQAKMSPERQQKNAALAALSQLQQLAAQTRGSLGTADLATLDYEAMFHELLLELERILNTPADG